MRRLWKKLDEALQGLLDQFSVAVLGDDGVPLSPAMVPTGLAALDDVLGGGLPCGRVVEVFGPPMSGKSRLALTMVAACQRRGAVAAWVDAESAFDARAARAAGVDLERLVVVRPRTGEQAFQVVDALARDRAALLIVIDSVAALLPELELHAAVGEAAVGLHARMVSAALRRLQGRLFEAGAVLLCLNQTRTAFEADGRAVQGTTGGQALAFYAGARLEIAPTAAGAALVVRKAPGVSPGARAAWDRGGAEVHHLVHPRAERIHGRG